MQSPKDIQANVAIPAAALGVRRVTFGSAPMRATLGLVRRMARKWKEKGTYGTLDAYGIPFAELQKLFA